MVRKERDQGLLRLRGEKIVKALVHREHRAAFFAPREDSAQQRLRGQEPGGVVRLAEEDEVHARHDAGEEVLLQDKARALPQRGALHGAARERQRAAVLRKRRRGEQGAPRPHGQRQAIDQVRSARAAEHLRRPDRVARGQRPAQLAAGRVRVAVRGLQRRLRRAADARRQA